MNKDIVIKDPYNEGVNDFEERKDISIYRANCPPIIRKKKLKFKPSFDFILGWALAFIVAGIFLVAFGSKWSNLLLYSGIFIMALPVLICGYINIPKAIKGIFYSIKESFVYEDE